MQYIHIQLFFSLVFPSSSFLLFYSLDRFFLTFFAFPSPFTEWMERQENTVQWWCLKYLPGCRNPSDPTPFPAWTPFRMSRFQAGALLLLIYRSNESSRTGVWLVGGHVPTSSSDAWWAGGLRASRQSIICWIAPSICEQQGSDGEGLDVPLAQRPSLSSSFLTFTLSHTQTHKHTHMITYVLAADDSARTKKRRLRAASTAPRPVWCASYMHNIRLQYNTCVQRNIGF